MDIEAIKLFLSTTATELAIKIAAAVAFWVIGRWLIGKAFSMARSAKVL